MTTYVLRGGKMVDKARAEPMQGGNSAFVISDTMQPLRHMADGRTYDSKSKFRQATKASGCIEVGTETVQMLKPRTPIPLNRGQRRDDIRKAIYELRNRKS